MPPPRGAYMRYDAPVPEQPAACAATSQRWFYFLLRKDRTLGRTKARHKRSETQSGAFHTFERITPSDDGGASYPEAQG